MKNLPSVFLLTVLLILGLATPAVAQFVQSDLAGTWRIHGLTNPNPEDDVEAGGTLRGTITVGPTGNVVSGSLTLSDGTVETFLAGTRVVLAANGLITGAINSAGVAYAVRATMTPDKQGVIGVLGDTTTHQVNDIVALVRQTSTEFSSADLAGRWVVYGVSTPEVALEPGANARGSLLFDESGEFQSGAIVTGGGTDTLASSGLIVSSEGVITGTLSGSTEAGLVDYDVRAVMEPGKDVIVGVNTRDAGGTEPRYHSFFVALRVPDETFTAADLAGTWRTYLHVVVVEGEEGGGEAGAWLEGPLTIRATDGAVSGTLRNGDGTVVTVTGGALAIAPGDDPSTRVSGTVQFRLVSDGATLTGPVSFQGALTPARDRIAGAVSVTLTGGEEGVVLTGMAVMVRPPVSTVQFSAATYQRSEMPGGSVAMVTVTRTGTLGAVSVDWATAGGSATPGVDYTAASGTLDFPNGVASRSFPITIADDLLPEGNETVALVLRNPTGGAVIGPRSTASLVIVDDEQAVQFALDGLTVTEGALAPMVGLTRSGPTAGAFTVPITVSGGTAVSGQDYPASFNVTARFNAGQATIGVPIPLLNDTLLDGTKTLVLELGTPAPVAPALTTPAQLGARQTMTITITDNESAGAVKFATAASAVIEGGTARLAVTRMGTNLAGGVEIAYTALGTSTATGGGVDYTLLGSGTLTFGPGVTMRTIEIATTQDTSAELPETVVVQLSNPQGFATLISPTTHTLTITDNDTAGVLRFLAGDLQVAEANTTVTLTVVRSGMNLASGVGVSYTVTGGSATGGGVDYVLDNGVLSFGANETSKTIAVEIVGDLLAEGNETIMVTLSSPTGRATIGAPGVARITIVDDEQAVQFSASGITVNEGMAAAVVTLARSGPLMSAFTVPVTIAGGTAVAGQDYPNTFTGGVVAFGATQRTATLSVPLLRDGLLDGPKTLILELGTPSSENVLPGSQVQTTITITDIQSAGAIGFAATASTVAEGRVVRVIVNRAGMNLAGGVTVDYAVSSGTATADTDFTLSGSGTLTFAAGATSAFIDVTALADTLKESTETLVVQLSNPSSGATLATGKTLHTVSITDANQAGVIQWEFATTTINEEDGALTLRIKRTGMNLAQGIVVNYALDPMPGTATSGSDYSFTPGMVTFGAGETEKTVILTPINDSLVEPAETVRLTLTAGAGGPTIGAKRTVVVSIVDGAERFNGSFRAAYSGTIDGEGTSGTALFSVNNTEIDVSQVCAFGECESVSGTGTVGTTGATTFTSGLISAFGATCNYTGTFTAASTGPATARGTWTCTGSGSGSGTWTASRTSLVP